MTKTIAFIDLEIHPKEDRILDMGCILSGGAAFHKNALPEFLAFIRDAAFLCGHNILRHDLIHLQNHTGNPTSGFTVIDTLFLSPLLFPSRPYHHLLKDDKLQTESLNNPLNDAKKASDLFYDEVAAFHSLHAALKAIYYHLLHQEQEFAGFFAYLDDAGLVAPHEPESLIRSVFEKKICRHADLRGLMGRYPVALAYTLALINVTDQYSITPPWVLHTYPDVDAVMFLLRNKPCPGGCDYCNEALHPLKALQHYFGFSSFRLYNGMPLQEDAVRAAIHNRSLLAVFPTGGGKSLTFQVPALMSGANEKSLTVVISPLQSLMKDQVDNLERKGITEAVTINGMQDPVERQKAIERVEGMHKEAALANILYISPEALRSVTIERLLLNRKIARFVIDEAHCFSSWGQDFRVDYLYIGDFIRSLQLKKGLTDAIPVSCFTATARPKVIDDICTYFKAKLNLDLDIFRADATRSNLHYKVFNRNGEEEKYSELRRLLEAKKCPAIIYVSRTRRAYHLAKLLCGDGFNARPYHGKMAKEEKIANQNAFIAGTMDIMVATSAFGMGVDKENVGMVVHYEISDSLENYVQEAGRAGRNESVTADCYVLFSEEDLDKHFILLNQTKLDVKEINQVWKAIKDLTRTRGRMSHSALEIARKAGWDDSIADIETRVKTAIAALEEAGYVQRGQNMPRVYASSILCKTAQEAVEKINGLHTIGQRDKEKAIRIIRKLFSSKSKRLATEEPAESRIDYMADHLGIVREEVIRVVNLLRDEKILADSKDLTAFIKGENNRSLAIAENFSALEQCCFAAVDQTATTCNLKALNEQAANSGCKDVTPNKINTLLNFWAVKNWIRKHADEYSKHHIHLKFCEAKAALKERMDRRHYFSRIIVKFFYHKAGTLPVFLPAPDETLMEFSVLELKTAIQADAGLFSVTVSTEDIEDTLFYLSRIEAIKIEGGFLVVYNRLTINRLEQNNRIQYKDADYQKLAQFYRSKVQQIHIVGEYARKMVVNYQEALQFTDDYFRLNYTSFLQKYFPGSRQDDILQTLTPARFKQLFGSLSPAQLKIIRDKNNQHIVVTAGPGSGKTRVLVHKLASLLLTEDVKHEQLLMLTFSRAAATEFKKRLLALIGNAAHFIEIKTFHSYCFDLTGRVGSLHAADGVIQLATDKIKKGDIETNTITKTVLVIDEAQDMDVHEYNLVQALMEKNEGMRVILVGDDDQNIYGFRGASSAYMQQFMEAGAVTYALPENFRSRANLVDVANQWAATLPNRLKTLPVIAHQSEPGQIKIIQYTSRHLIRPLVEDMRQAALCGSTCVLTKTNEEAVHITGLLVKNGFTARLIQSNDGFNLYHLEELRYFTSLLQQHEAAFVIGNAQWLQAKHAFCNTFKESNKLDWCLAMIGDFERTNPLRKYFSDWKSFVWESKLEDFLHIAGDTIYVSTIHKAKGREFDNVCIMLDHFNAWEAECGRQLYVAITRAKNNLVIHYNGTYLKDVVADNLTVCYDRQQHQAPAYLGYALNHKDVHLGYFTYVQKRLWGMHAGAPLYLKEEGLTNTGGELVVKFSAKFKEAISAYGNKGYVISQAKINFIVYWKSPDGMQEVKIILPEVMFKQMEAIEK